MKLLKEEYCKTFPMKLERIRSLIDSLKKNWTKDNLDPLRFDIHKLAGSAGTYGYDKISEMSKVIEEYIIKELDHFDPLSINKELLIKLDQFFESLRQGFSCEYS